MNKVIHKRGFTLVEILVALAIIAIALAALMRASGDHTYSASYLKQKTLAHYVAMNELAKLQIEKKWPRTGEENKSTEMADHEWYWKRNVEKSNKPAHWPTHKRLLRGHFYRVPGRRSKTKFNFPDKLHSENRFSRTTPESINP